MAFLGHQDAWRNLSSIVVMCLEKYWKCSLIVTEYAPGISYNEIKARR